MLVGHKEAAVTRRGDQAQRTAEALADAARELIRERGYREATVEDIASAAGVTPRTFFRHFESKASALFARRDRVLQQRFAEALEDRPDDEPLLDAVRAAMRVFAAAVDDNRSWMFEIGRLASDVPEIREHLESGFGAAGREVIVSWAERRIGAPSVVDPRPQLLAGLAAACADAAILRFLAHAGSLDAAALLEESFDRLADLLDT